MDYVPIYDILRTRKTVLEMLKDRGFSLDIIPTFTLQTIETILEQGETSFEKLFFISTQKMDEPEPVQTLDENKTNLDFINKIRKIDFRDQRIIGEPLIEKRDVPSIEVDTLTQKQLQYLFIEDISKLTPGNKVIVTDYQNDSFQKIGVIQDILSDGTIMVLLNEGDDSYPYQKDQLNLVIETDVIQPTITSPWKQTVELGEDTYLPTTPPYTPGEDTYLPTTPPSQDVGSQELTTVLSEEPTSVDDAIPDSSGGARIPDQKGGAKKDKKVDDEEPAITVDSYDKMKRVWLTTQTGGVRKKIKEPLNQVNSIEVHFIYPNKTKQKVKKIFKTLQTYENFDNLDVIFVLFEEYDKKKQEKYGDKKKQYEKLLYFLNQFEEFERPNIQIFQYKQLVFNITHHEYVPKHTLLNTFEINQVLDKHYLTSIDQLPSILTNDPIVRYYGAKVNDVFRIERSSKSIGKSIYYRHVMDKNIVLEN